MAPIFLLMVVFCFGGVFFLGPSCDLQPKKIMVITKVSTPKVKLAGNIREKEHREKYNWK